MNTNTTSLTRENDDCLITGCGRQVHLNPPRVLIIDDTRTIHNDFRKILANGDTDRLVASFRRKIADLSDGALSS